SSRPIWGRPSILQSPKGSGCSPSVCSTPTSRSRMCGRWRSPTRRASWRTRTLKICLAGTGAMGVVHMKALQKLDDVQVVSIASRAEPRGKAFADEWKIPFQSTSLEACIDQPGVDAVILTTPSDQHADQTTLALSMGKHVQVEIPMALNLADS